MRVKIVVVVVVYSKCIPDGILRVGLCSYSGAADYLEKISKPHVDPRKTYSIFSLSLVIIIRSFHFWVRLKLYTNR